MYQEKKNANGREPQEEPVKAAPVENDPCTHAVDAEQTRLEDPDDGGCDDI